MKEYEIHVSASYMTDGGTKEWTYFKEYVQAETAAAAKSGLKAELKAQGYRNIKLDTIKV